jgi:hypothetical protein
MDEEYERELKILENGGFAGNPYRKRLSREDQQTSAESL